MKNISFCTAVLCLLTLFACDLEKEIELELPDYANQTVVECYLEPGKPFSLLLTKSDGFFAPIPTDDDRFLENTLEEGAEVTISYGEETVTLTNDLIFNPFSGKVYNYANLENTVPADYETEFTLQIVTADGERITGKTRIAPPTPIDSFVIERSAENDTLFRALTYITDDVTRPNFYRRMQLFGPDDEVQQDFAIDDELLDSEISIFGTAFEYGPGDTLAASIMQINEDYYRFFNSVSNAVDSNGNPFGQPGVIVSNVEGEEEPLGIFTGFVRFVERRIL